MKKLILCLSLSFFSLSIAAQSSQSVETLTLEKSVRIAITNSVAVLQAKGNYELTGAQVLQAYGQFLPSLSASVGYTPIALNQRINPTTLPGGVVIFPLFAQRTTGLNFNIVSSLNLFNGLADQAGLQQALSNNRGSEYTLTRAKQDIAFNVAQGYLQILLNQELLRISQENLKASQERLRQLQEQTRLGSRAIADLYQQEAQKAADELAVIRADNTLRNSKLALLRQLRLEPTKEYEFVQPATDTTMLDEQYKNEQALISAALESRSDVKGSQESVNANSWAVTQARSTYLPQLNLNFSFGSNGFNVLSQSIDGASVNPPALPSLLSQVGNQLGYSLGLQLSWTLFDRFSTNLRQQQAEITFQNSQLAYEDLKIRVAVEVKQALGDYNAAISQLESTRRGLVSAEKAFETVQKRYEVGSATFVEVITAQAALVQAQSNRAQAVFNFTFQKKILEYFLGKTDVNSL
jgi:outer membrane protein